MSDDRAETQALADLLADLEIRAIWEEELWDAIAGPVIRRHFEYETGLGRWTITADPFYDFTNAAEREDHTCAWTYVEWFNERCWPRGQAGTVCSGQQIV